MDWRDVLITHAELSLALAGFAGVVAALRSPISRFRRQRFLAMVGLALAGVAGSLTPLLVEPLSATEAQHWRLCTAGLALGVALYMTWGVVLPMARLGRRAFFILSRGMTAVAWGLAGLCSFALVANVAGVPAAPNFYLYYSVLAAGLVIGLILFADVALRGDDDPAA